MIEILIFNGLRIQVHRRKNCRHIILRANEQGLCVSAPLHCSERKIREILQLNMTTLLEKQEEIGSQKKRYSDGEIHYYLGKAHRLRCIASNQNTCKIDGDEIVLEYRDNADIESALHAFFKVELQRIAGALLAFQQDRMGLFAKEMRLKKMKTRWGTCNHKEKRIWLSLMLIHESIEFINYVVIHELAHLAVPNHSAQFYEIVARYCPNYKSIMKDKKSC